jgi:putative FmdB family regulatory protein
MPTYEYHCDACENHFDEFQSITEKPLKKCPKCGRQKLRRVFGAGAAIIFKGSGFYQTDYRSESYKQAANAEQESAKPAEKNGTATPAAKDATTNGTTSSSGKGAKTSGKKAKSKG